MASEPFVSALACPDCLRRTREPIYFNMPLDVRWEWSQQPWTKDDLQFYQADGRSTRHVYHEGSAHPACAPWWLTGIAPVDPPFDGKPLWRRPQLVERGRTPPQLS